MRVFLSSVRPLGLLFFALALASAGCVDNTAGDMALAQVQRLEAQTRMTEARLGADEARQMYVAQQLSMISGVMSSLQKENAARAEEQARKDDEAAQRIDRLEKAEIVRRERAEAEAPRLVVDRAQALIDSGKVKVVVKNGKARLELLDATPPPVEMPARPATSPELEDPWAKNAIKKPALTKKPARQEDLGF